jgi:glycosyltransferase involved in cell wall biosynthesis
MEGGIETPRRLRIGIVAPPLVRVPPTGYAGTERIVATVALGLHERGHEVTVFASGDSDLPCEVVPVVPHSLWGRGVKGDTTAYLQMSVAMAWEQAERFDVIHSHVEQAGFLMARHCPTPVITTLHKRVDVGGIAQLIDLMPDVPLVAISESQRRWNPDANWIATIHHGLDFSHTPTSLGAGDYLLLVGRLSPQKGVSEAIEVARQTGHRLVMAAKAHEGEEREMFEAVVRPAIDEGVVDWRGEVGGEERDRLMAGAYATLMLGAWPEPFGLVAIESMATGTPVIARRAGGVTETIEHGSTGFLVDDVSEAVLAVERVARLRRDRIAAYARGRFSAERMTALYEQAFSRLLDDTAAARRGGGVAVGPGQAPRDFATPTSETPRSRDDHGLGVSDIASARRSRPYRRETVRRPIRIAAAGTTPAS